MAPFEIRYLDVIWHDPNTILRLESSQSALLLEERQSGWQVETTTFPSTYHYIGIRVTDDNVLHNPFFILADGRQERLLMLISPSSNEKWWIQSSGWDAVKNRYFSELYRTTGRADLIIQDQRLMIKNNCLNFSVNELEYYLSDFKNNLWLLILSQSSAIKANVYKEMPNCFNDEALGLFRNFSDSIENIINNPSMVLSETQKKMPLRLVKPVPRTFREYAIHPNVKILTSRSFYESYDTPENRFIHYCVKRALYIIKSLYLVSNSQSTAYSQKINQLKEELMNLSDKKDKKVDPDVFENETLKLKADLDLINTTLENMITTKNQNNDDKSEDSIYSFSISKQYGKMNNCFFVSEIKNIIDKKTFKPQHPDYLVIQLPNTPNILELQKVRNPAHLVIKGRCIKNRDVNNNGKSYYTIKFIEIHKIHIEQHPFEEQSSRKRTLEIKNWTIPLSQEEIKDIQNSKEVAEKKIEYYQKISEKMHFFSSVIPALQKRLLQSERFFKKEKVKISPNLPNTMVFIQNLFYASAKMNFKKISNINGLDESLLNSLIIIDEIGLINVAILYERWCLIQIVKVLTQVYEFKAEKNWKKILVDAILEQKFNIEIRFSAPERHQKLTLTYEKTLKSGKRPDFVIDLETFGYKKNSEIWECSQKKSHRLVLDAKFRGEMTENQLNELVMSLYQGKNYSEDNKNEVFIVHPSQKTIKKPTSPLSWGRYCDYGQSHKTDHRYGSIFLSPSLEHSSSFDHLQRLIGMFLQKNSEILKDEKDPNNSWHNMSCISCGNGDVSKFELTYQPTAKGNPRWIIHCKPCGLLTVQTRCFECTHTLFKNGWKWTYHRTRAEQTSNVVCPACETFL